MDNPTELTLVGENF